MKNFEQSRKMYHKQYIEGNTEISDIAYDALEKKGNLPPAFQDISDLDNKNEHAFPMLS